MSTEVAQDGNVQYAAVDPKNLEEGDTVIVSDVAEDGETRGTVEATKNEWGRYGVELTREDGVTVMVWEETGRTFTRVKSLKENKNKNELSYNIYGDDAYDGDLMIAGEVVPTPVFVGAHRRARNNDADRAEAKPIHTPAGRLPDGRNY